MPSTNTSGIITRIGSPIVSATVVTADRASFSDLIEPVTIGVRLDPVTEGVSGVKFSCQVPQALCLSCFIAEYYTLHMCILGFQPCR